MRKVAGKILDGIPGYGDDCLACTFIVK